jgi:hypothetical protein
MKIVKALWHDECGLILSAEAVTVGTVGVLGAVVGMNMACTAVDEELKEMAFAFRSLDQSFEYPGHRSCCAWSAGSAYRQPDVQVSRNGLSADGAADIRETQEQSDAQQKDRLPSAPQPQTDGEQAVPAAPNQIPVPGLNKEESKSDVKADVKGKDSDKKASRKKKTGKDKPDRDEV